MIGYICKYAPIEVLAGFGIETEQISPTFMNGQGNTTPGEASICSCAKAVMNIGKQGKYEAIIVTDACDGLEWVADTLEQAGTTVYRLSLPRVQSGDGPNMYSGEIRKFIQKLALKYKTSFDMEKFVAAIAANARQEREDHVALIGACAPDWLKTIFEVDSGLPLVDYTYAQNRREFDDVNKRIDDGRSVIDWYAEQLICQFPCMRMQDVPRRQELMEELRIKGILYHSAKNCNFYGMEFAEMGAVVPTLKLETDASHLARGKAVKEIQVFLERNGWLQHPTEMEAEPFLQEEKPSGYYIGIDSGTSTTNVVILDNAKNVVASATISTGAKCQQSAKLAVEALLKQNKIDKKDVRYTIATGYGRSVLNNVDKDVTEITCHAKGAHHLFPQTHTVIDVGGQDCMVIQLDEDGNVADFLMNDKCASGTGRFLEMMADKLNLSMDDFVKEGLNWENEVVISSMCAVFAESEVAALMEKNIEVADIVQGINRAVANHLLGMIVRGNCVGDYVMTGGVAKNTGVVDALSDRLGETVWLPPEPQLIGALGAALLAVDEK